MSDSREVLALPCHDTASWEEDRTLFNLLANLNSLQEFTQLIASQTREGSSSLRARLERFSGLLVFLEKYCSEDERTVFFERTLPFITNAAARLKEREPASGIPFLRGQESELISRILASINRIFFLYLYKRCFSRSGKATGCISTGQCIPVYLP